MIESETPPQIQTEAAAESPPESAPAPLALAERAQQEVEIKFATDAAGLAAALASPLLRVEKPGRARKLVSIYFDTPDWALKKRKMALRVRRSGRAAPVMTLKWPAEAAGDVFVRGEAEVRARTMEPDISLFDPDMAASLREILGEAPLEAKYETRVNRTARLIAHGAARIEAAVDEGAIHSGARELPLREVELELKSGPAQDFFDFAALLAENLPLRLDNVSKAERATHFCQGTAPKPVRSKPADLPAEANLDEATARIILGTIEHFLVNWASLRASDDPESIHQMRVALRRLRAALGMLKRTIPCLEFEAFREEAKALASAFGAARDSDALRELIEQGPMGHFGERKDFAPLLDALEKRRAAAYEESRALIESPRPTLFVLRLSAFVARRGWRNAVQGLDLATLTEPIAIFAAQALERLYKRALKRGKKLVTLPDEQRHQVRIALKNLRYAGEFFAACFADRRDPAPFLRAAANLQGLLGAHNDAASADHFLSASHAEEAARAAGIVSGWYARGAVIADRGLAREWKRFKAIRPFWR
ncbi:CYTH and CHAD domain-containing protein [Rhodoblastus sp.]|uniref:CYTH and CHAD domain-containing protein n=1 Tax=Rhodoblastus sp. TaxID=1962975 RepID=UPI003F98712B